jgi:hypothetical protein
MVRGIGYSILFWVGLFNPPLLILLAAWVIYDIKRK